MSTKYETFGKYVLLEKLATGGMAEVYLARGSGAGGISKFFAIKRILPQFSDSPEFIDMFKEEAKIAINLSHSNIVSIHEFDIKNDMFYLVMDYVEGRNLRQILNKMKKGGMQFSIDQIVFAIKEVSAGLDHAHRCLDGTTGKPLNITHRDMSPQNVMVSFEGEVKIVDFGIAKAESQIETTRAGTLKGKFGYMSPEQAEGQTVDLRTDIFSIGIVLWELLANDRLFMANNEINTLRKIRDCQIPSLRKINPNIHSELERIVMKALAKDRNLRYQTCAALHRDLNRFLNRQYPDFAPQDFAVFIKSVFADEILSLRKRLVDYSKINPESVRSSAASMGNSGKQERHNLLNTQTSSLVVSNTDSEAEDLDTPQAHTPPPAHTSSRNVAPTRPFVPPPSPPPPTTPPVPEIALQMADEDVEPKQPARINEQRNPRAYIQEAVFSPVSTGRIPIHTEDVPEITSPSISRNTGFSRYTRSQIEVPKRRVVPAISSLLYMTMMICIVYVGLAKLLPVEMAPVIAKADPYLGPVHKLIGIDATDQASKHVDPPPVKPPPVQPQTVQPPPVQPPPVQPPADPPNGSTGLTTAVVVTSYPSGAEIIIDGEVTGLSTPSPIQVPSDRPFKIEIRKKGYLSFIRPKIAREEMGQKLEMTLVKANVAYIDVDVIPPTPVTLYINGVALKDETPPLRNYPVSANVELKIKAVDGYQNSSDEQALSIPENKRRHIQLFLKKKH